MWDLVLMVRERSCESYYVEAVKRKFAKRRWNIRNIKIIMVIQQVVIQFIIINFIDD